MYQSRIIIVRRYAVYQNVKTLANVPARFWDSTDIDIRTYEDISLGRKHPGYGIWMFGMAL